LKKEETMPKSTERAVLVTTAHKGVFFGYASETGGSTITLKKAQLAVYWTADLRGFMGLASQGPNGGCRIGQPVDSIELRDITAVVVVSKQAEEKWLKAPWA
jgi:hypothetical protein